MDDKDFPENDWTIYAAYALVVLVVLSVVGFVVSIGVLAAKLFMS